jgi:hypothetical protein
MGKSTAYYQPSGHFSPVGIAIMIGVSIVGCMISSLLYAFALHFFVQHIVLVTMYNIIYGMLVGLSGWFGVKFGKLRNAVIVYSLGVFVSLFGVYAAWVSWIYVLSNFNIFTLNPFRIYSVAMFLAEKGLWSVYGFTPTGWLIFVIWLIELLVIIGVTFFALHYIVSLPYCESCDCWADKRLRKESLTAIKNLKQFKVQLERGDMTELVGFVPVQAKECTDMVMLTCRNCLKTAFLDVWKVNIAKNADGEEKRQTKKVISNLVLSPENIKVLRPKFR